MPFQAMPPRTRKTASNCGLIARNRSGALMSESMKSAIPASREALAGAAVYSKMLLAIYDVEVLMLEMPYVFGCPLRKMLDFYNEHVSGKHLDVGVGSGYFLDKCRFPVGNPEIHLMDLNRNSLSRTAKRIRRYRPVTHRWNVLEPVQEALPRFNSIGAGNFLHCLPGTMSTKGIVFQNLKPFLSEEGVFFGMTILGRNVDAGALYRTANSLYNKLSIFCNLNDSLADLDGILHAHFRTSSVSLAGGVALFAAHP